MYGLAKTAFLESYHHQKMTPAEFQQYTENLKEQYGHDTDYMIDKTRRGLHGKVAVDPEQVQKLQRRRLARNLSGFRGYEGNGDSVVKVSPYEEAILHETGNILNPDYMDNDKKGRYWTGGSLVGAIALGRTTVMSNNPFVRAAAGLGAIGGGILGTRKGVSYFNENREKANEFAKQHWERELGSSQLAEERFGNSKLHNYGNENTRKAYLMLGSAGGSLLSNVLRKEMAMRMIEEGRNPIDPIIDLYD